MQLALPEVQALRTLTVDGRWLVLTRAVRMFAYGFLSVVLALYLAALGLSERQIGVVLTLTLLGDAVMSLGITTLAERLGRRRMLCLGTALMVFAGLMFLLSSHFAVLLVAACIGTLSPSGGEVGPFTSIEQGVLPQITPPAYRTQVFAWYNLVGTCAAGSGALSGGALAQALQHAGATALTSYRMILLGYVGFGLLLGLIFTRLSAAMEAPAGASRSRQGIFGLHQSRRVVFKLAALFMLDAFSGGLVVESLMAYWFYVRFGVEPALLGSLFFGTHLFAGLSSLAAARLAARFGLLNTMVFTHLPSNVLLILVPLMPNLPLAMTMLLLRSCLSQMDVPTRQSYTMAVVTASERTAAAGITTVARTAARAWAPLLTGALLQASWLSWPFILAGSLKIVYDFALYRGFRQLHPPEEQGR